MFRALRNWIIRKLGGHTCDEFTQWRTKTVHGTVRRYIPSEGVLLEPVEISRTFQERQCTICGKVEQRSLPDLS